MRRGFHFCWWREGAPPPPSDTKKKKRTSWICRNHPRVTDCVVLCWSASEGLSLQLGKEASLLPSKPIHTLLTLPPSSVFQRTPIPTPPLLLTHRSMGGHVWCYDRCMSAACPSKCYGASRGWDEHACRGSGSQQAAGTNHTCSSDQCILLWQAFSWICTNTLWQDLTGFSGVVCFCSAMNINYTLLHAFVIIWHRCIIVSPKVSRICSYTSVLNTRFFAFNLTNYQFETRFWFAGLLRHEKKKTQ